MDSISCVHILAYLNSHCAGRSIRQVELKLLLTSHWHDVLDGTRTRGILLIATFVVYGDFNTFEECLQLPENHAVQLSRQYAYVSGP